MNIPTLLKLKNDRCIGSVYKMGLNLASKSHHGSHDNKTVFYHANKLITNGNNENHAYH